MKDKLFEIRLQIHYTNSRSYNAGCETIFVVAPDQQEGERITDVYFKDYYKKNNIEKRIAHVVFCKEVDGLIQEPEKPLTRKVYTEKVFKTRLFQSR